MYGCFDCMYVYVLHMCWRLEEVVGSPGTRMTHGCHVGAGKQMQVLLRWAARAPPLSYLSALCCIVFCFIFCFKSQSLRNAVDIFELLGHNLSLLSVWAITHPFYCSYMNSVSPLVDLFVCLFPLHYLSCQKRSSLLLLPHMCEGHCCLLTCRSSLLLLPHTCEGHCCVLTCSTWARKRRLPCFNELKVWMHTCRQNK